ncbi:hypothetical protein B0H14DRAFT_3531433 [Mycena olivaceomarginata]|nr:hypothetical protein B0H14DRAFT_3531433 [Mycena olivaceomarginata]
MAPTSLHPTPAAHHLCHPAHSRPTLHVPSAHTLLGSCGDKGNSKWTIANARRAVQTPDTLDKANNSWEIHVAHATPVARAPELDEANSSWTIGKDPLRRAVDEAKNLLEEDQRGACHSNCPCIQREQQQLDYWKCVAPTPDLRQHLLAYREPDCTDPLTWYVRFQGWCANAYFYRSQVDSNNTSWHIGSRTAPTPVACTVSPNLVDSNNTSLKIGCSVPTPVACAVSPDLVDSNNTPWKIGGSVPTPVAARAVSPDLVDGDNTSWKILCNPVVQARAENVDSDNKSWEIHDTREEVDAANTSWIIGSNEACAVPISDLVDGGSLTEVLLWPLCKVQIMGEESHSLEL